MPIFPLSILQMCPNVVFSFEVCIMQQFLIVYLELKQGALTDQERGKGKTKPYLIYTDHSQSKPQ